MKLPKITIITPSYNQDKFIEDTILSVVNQQYSPLEYIVIDGGSTDKSVDIIKKYEKQITYWVSEKDSGQSHAINKGFNKATGEIIAWLNSDDMYLPETLNYVARIFNDNPEVDLVLGDVENFYEDGSAKIHKNEFTPIDFLSRVSIHQPGVFWKRRLLDKIGLLDEDLHYCMDYDLWMRMVFSCKIIKANKVFSRFRIHGHSKTGDNPPAMYKEMNIVISRFFNSVKDSSFKEKLIKKGIYDNPDEKKYQIDLSDMALLNKTYNNYVFNRAVQEYTFGSRKKTNDLFVNSLNKKNFAKVIWFLIKNNLGARQFKS